MTALWDCPNCGLCNKTTSKFCQACFQQNRFEHDTLCINANSSTADTISIGYWIQFNGYEEQYSLKRSDYPDNYVDHLNLTFGIGDVYCVAESYHHPYSGTFGSVEETIKLIYASNNTLHLIKNNRLLQMLFADIKCTEWWHHQEYNKIDEKATDKCIENLLGVTVATIDTQPSHKEIRDGFKPILGEVGCKYYITGTFIGNINGQCVCRIYLLCYQDRVSICGRDGDDSDVYYGYEIKNFRLPLSTIEKLLDYGMTQDIAQIISFMALS